ncbi:hypothetical protein [Aliidiomarina maris]|uniref:ABC transporter substrate-binding protein n=1 Tax=Aliidiomarina maris TaxID=531312 RepID=A0A327WV03_9GAMM|nr:hypothetical protein [Aliidiomarina maris]MBA3988315.1 hypothetical protein [Idiomarina sp.]RAJ96881.1 hypothetical protein B0I24_10792 [Aliidiomarina maris]RUO24180.1 hypothetical protein CWE07_08820 [Aliidiomarina maris]
MPVFQHLSARVARLSCLLLAGFALSACSSSPTETPSSSVRITDSELQISGFISEATIEQVRSLTSSYNVERVRVNVTEGDPLATMQLGYFIHRRELDLVVEEYCLSVCANYLFTAARQKYLAPESIVAFSGGALSSSWTQQHQGLLIPGVRFVAEQYMDAFLRREIRFFDRIAVDQTVTAYGYTEASGCTETAHQGFYYSIPELLRFGIGDIEPIRSNWRDAFNHYPEQFCQVDLSNQALTHAIP